MLYVGDGVQQSTVHMPSDSMWHELFSYKNVVHRDLAARNCM